MSTTRKIRSRSAGPSHATAAAVAGFLDAQHRVLERYRVDAERRFVVPTVGGCAQVLVAGEGPRFRWSSAEPFRAPSGRG